MEYQKIANLIDGESNQPSKFSTNNWVELLLLITQLLRC